MDNYTAVIHQTYATNRLHSTDYSASFLYAPVKDLILRASYGTGFLRTGAKAVFANGRGSLSSILTDLLTSDKSIGQIFEDDWSFTGERDFTFASTKTPGATVWMDPYAKGKYYKAVVGKLVLTAAQVRAGG